MNFQNNQKSCVRWDFFFKIASKTSVFLSSSVSWQVFTPSTTQTVCSPTCTTVSTASQENWLMRFSRQRARSTSTTMSTGFWGTCASAGRKAGVFGRVLFEPMWTPPSDTITRSVSVCRCLVDRPRPRGDARNRPRPRTHALHEPQSYNASERNSDRAQAHHPGRGVGFAPSVRYVS